MTYDATFKTTKSQLQGISFLTRQVNQYFLYDLRDLDLLRSSLDLERCFLREYLDEVGFLVWRRLRDVDRLCADLAFETERLRDRERL